MVKQVPVVASLMIANGAIVSLMGLYLVVMGPFLFTMMNVAPPPGPGGPKPGDKAVLTAMSVVYLVLGLVVLTAAVLNIVAGIRSLSFRSRTLALVALFSNLAPMFTCYCIPTSLGLMIYGLIVFFQPDVARAFALVAEGVPAERFKRGWRPDEDEEEDDEPLPEELPPQPRGSDKIQRGPDDTIRRPWPEAEE
jgi:hypothetical protein